MRNKFLKSFIIQFAFQIQIWEFDVDIAQTEEQVNETYLNNLLEIIQSEIMGVGNETTNMEIMRKNLENKDNSSIFWRPQSVSQFSHLVVSYSLQPQ